MDFIIKNQHERSLPATLSTPECILPHHLFSSFFLDIQFITTSFHTNKQRYDMFKISKQNFSYLRLIPEKEP